jgi:succinate dehydrogenase / fumarate reductase membrane anchor subunit
MTASARTVEKPKNYEAWAWKWMRYSGILMLPLVWGHVLIQDVVVGVHAIDNAYVLARWSSLFWQTYDILLLAFTFAHGMNGLRQVLYDVVHTEKARRRLARLLFVVWLVISAIGGIAIVAAAQKHLAGL